ncbi:hypothetical protein Tco_1279205 [Tanacetum coccineum]
MHTHSQTRNCPQQQVPPNIEPFNLEEPIQNQAPPVVTMDDQRTMVQLLQAPTEDYEDAIVYLNLNMITSTLKFLNVLNMSIKLMLFPFYLEGTARIWLKKELPRACPHHGFSKLHQLDTFYNALNSNDQDSLNSAAGVSTSSSTPGVSPDVAELKDMVRALLLDKKNQSQAPATVKAVEESCVTCGGAHSYRNCPATDGNVYHDNIQEYVSQAAAVNYN